MRRQPIACSTKSELGTNRESPGASLAAIGPTEAIAVPVVLRTR